MTVLIFSAFGLCLGAPSTYNAVLVLTAFVGFGIGGKFPIDATITLEFLPQNRRFLLAALIFQPIGVVVCSGIAYGFIPNYSCAADLQSCSRVFPGAACCTRSSNMGWRYLLFTLGGITLAVFFLHFVVFRFQESPKFLLYRGQNDQAVAVLQYIAHFKNCQCSITSETFSQLSSEDSSAGSAESTSPIIGFNAKKPHQTWRTSSSSLPLALQAALRQPGDDAPHAPDLANLRLRLLRLHHRRQLPPHHPAPQKRLPTHPPPPHLPHLHLHLPLRHPWCPCRHTPVPRAQDRASDIVSADGDIALPLRRRQYRG